MLNLLADLREEFGLTYIFISHDLNVVRFISDRVMVMYLGEVVEIGPVDELYGDPRHPYTRALLSAMPSMDPDNRTMEAPLAGDPPNPINPPEGCRFHPRCPQAQTVCAKVKPVLARTGDGRARRPPATWRSPAPATAARPQLEAGRMSAAPRRDARTSPCAFAARRPSMRSTASR